MKKTHWLAVLTALVLALGILGIAHAEIIPAYGEGQIGLQAVVLCEELTVRAEPSSSAQAVKKLHYGDKIIAQPQTGGWAACFLSDSVDEGRAGWVNEDYLAIDPAWLRTEAKTPVYAWNDTMAPKVALLDANTTLPILKDDGEWLVVSLRGAAGWIHQENYVAAASEAFVSPADPAVSPVAGAGAQRQNGERFEEIIMLEGMPETVHYEHVVSEDLGIEIDYDYELFVRRTEAGLERFASSYDSVQDPMDYLELRCSAEDADTVAASIGATLSQEYDITVAPYTLERAGNCTVINADVVKGTNQMASVLQTVYIIPAGDGCIVATAHMAIESSEGFGRRISYIMNTLELTDVQGE